MTTNPKVLEIPVSISPTHLAPASSQIPSFHSARHLRQAVVEVRDI